MVRAKPQTRWKVSAKGSRGEWDRGRGEWADGEQRRKSRLRHHTGWPYTYLTFSVIISVCFCSCIILRLNSNQVEARTHEMAPEGAVLLELNHVSARSLRARWTAPPRPNGNIIYTLHYQSKGSSWHLFPQFLATQTMQADIMQDITQGHCMSDILSIFDPHDFVSHHQWMWTFWVQSCCIIVQLFHLYLH